MRAPRPRLLALVALALLLAAGLAGCGLGAGESDTGGARARHARLRHETAGGADRPGPAVLRDGDAPAGAQLRGQDALRRRLRAVDRRARRRREDGRPVDWFYYVNGIEASVGAADVQLHDGDRIWWDRHDWGATPHVPAVVGSFPEPFAHGAEGKRYPVVLECADDVRRRLQDVSERLGAAGVIAARQTLGTGVGARNGARARRAAGASCAATSALAQLDRGPAASGVYARFSSDGQTARACSTPQGDAARTLGAGAGLVAATRFEAAGADLGDHRHRRGRRRRPRRARSTSSTLQRPLRARASTTGHAIGAARWWRRDARAPQRQPAARRARGGRLRAVRRARAAGAAVRQPARARRGRRRGARRRGRRRRRARAAPRAAAGAAVRAADRAGQPARHAQRADGDRAPRRGAGARPARRHARGARLRRRARPARARADPLLSRCTRPPSTPTSCCGCSAASRSARR